MRIETDTLMARYRDNVFAAAFSLCKNAADADDVVQNTFIRYHTTDKQFESEEHIRAWLMRVAVNDAKNVVRAVFRRHSVPLEDYAETLSFESPEAKDLFREVMRLPEKYRVVLHLFYYEGYAVRDISKILGESEGNVRVRLSRARGRLREVLREDWDND